jgi:hypothetical protein
VIGQGGPQHFTDQLWRAVLTLLATALGLYIAWSLIRAVLGPLILSAVLVGIMRLALLGHRSRRGW